MKVSSRKLKATDDLSVSVDVYNVGNYEGTEIVQLYINDIFISVTTPIKELKGFKRITLKPGEKNAVKITIPASSLSLVNRQCKSVVEPGEFEIMMGSSSRDKDLIKTTIEIV
ncbi:fibronectin type III-like domain-contianing protein [Lutibacter sp. B2]|nr:fibronectin type III-like domain-contianing protein [Lutibacter sp. B2]